LDTYVALSMPPAMRNLDQAWFKDAKQIFDQLECGSCHTPKLTTGSSEFTALSHRDFYPFTDMLLHDLGPELANGFPVLNASTQEWRTAPLWGIGLSESVSGRNGFLHDGRARTIEEAILWHGGEAEASKNAYKSLNAKQRALFVRFLESL
ncbi:MAG: di-heme oxidoredictase family protein, partial [Marinomonas gallaica]